jgi:molybdate transport system substrate-binding protein
MTVKRRSFHARARAIVLLTLVLAFASPSGALAQAGPAIAAASDLQFALDEIAAQFTADTGQALRLVYGSSGNIARQIEQGAPYELYLSADEAFVFRLADRGFTLDRGTLYAVGRIVLYTPHGSRLDADDGLAGVEAALDRGAIRRFAIANPEHAPYGRAAEQALRHAGLWERLRPHLVFGENVSQLSAAEPARVHAGCSIRSSTTPSGSASVDGVAERLEVVSRRPCAGCGA